MVNRMIRYMDDYPVMSMVTLPIAFFFGTTVISGVIRKAKFQSAFAGGIFDDEEQQTGSPIGSYQIRTEGGSPDDFMFRATASTAPTRRGTRVGDEIQAQPTGAPVRYDREYHDSIFLPNLNYKDNKQVLSQSYPAKVTDTYVFAGINGVNKIGMR